MEITAKLNNLRIAPRKVRLVADLVRGKSAYEANELLGFCVKRVSLPLKKLLQSCVQNSKHNFQIENDNLFIKEIKVDEVSKSVRGIIEPSELRDHGLIIKRREARDRTFYVKQPLERLNDLKMKFHESGSFAQSDLFGGEGTVLPTNILLIDVIHLLLGIAETGDNLLPWLEKFGGLRPQIRASMEYFIKNDKFTSAAKRVLSLIDERSLFTTESK